MLRTYDRFASPPECAATSNAGCGGGGGIIGAKDRPGNLTGASDPEVVAWAKQDRKSVVEGKRVDLGGRRIIKKKKNRREVVSSWLGYKHQTVEVRARMTV